MACSRTVAFARPRYAALAPNAERPGVRVLLETQCREGFRAAPHPNGPPTRRRMARPVRGVDDVRRGCRLRPAARYAPDESGVARNRRERQRRHTSHVGRSVDVGRRHQRTWRGGWIGLDRSGKPRLSLGARLGDA